MIVPRYLQIPSSADCRTGRPASSLSVVVPAAQGVTHVGGHMLGGPRIAQTGDAYESTTTGTHTWYAFRHPNCDYLYVEIRCSLSASQEAALTVQAGAGTAIEVDMYATDGVYQTIALRVPWASGDSGWCKVTAALDGVAIRSIFAWDWPAYSLTTSQHAVQIRDATYRRIGLRESDSIAAGTNGSTLGVLRALRQSWEDHRRVAVTWSSLVGVTATSSGWKNPFGPNEDWAWRHRARSYVDHQDYAEYYAWVNAKCSAGVTYSLAFTARNSEYGEEDAAVTGLTNTTTDVTKIGTVKVDARGYADLTITARITAGSGTITIYGVTIGEE